MKTAEEIIEVFTTKFRRGNLKSLKNEMVKSHKAYAEQAVDRCIKEFEVCQTIHVSVSETIEFLEQVKQELK